MTYIFCGIRIYSEERIALLDEANDDNLNCPSIFVDWCFNNSYDELEEIYKEFASRNEKIAASSFCDIIPKVKLTVDEKCLYYQWKLLFNIRTRQGIGTIKVYVSNDFPLELAQEVFISDALPLGCIGIDNCVFLHAACVTYGNKSFAFLGDTGAGKSTLTTFLCTQGFEIVSDDMICIRIIDDEVIVSQYLRFMRLWEESYRRLECDSVGKTPNGKYLVKCNKHKSNRITLDRLFLLNRGQNNYQIVPLTKMKGYINLVSSLIMGFAYSSSELKYAYEIISKIIKDKPVDELVYSNGYDKLLDLSKRIKEV